MEILVGNQKKTEGEQWVDLFLFPVIYMMNVSLFATRDIYD